MNKWTFEYIDSCTFFEEEQNMQKPSTQEIHAAIAAYISESREPFAALAQRLKISVSTLRRVASEFGIVRRQRLGESVLARIERSREEKPQ
jgi:hypothetical protein